MLALPDEIDRWLRNGASRASKGDTNAPEPSDVVMTDVLWSRHARPKQLEREVEVLLDLACSMARGTRKSVLSRIASYALTLCKAESSGFSLLEMDETGNEIFRWTATQGRMRPFEGGTTPANFSPCGYCLERDSAQLFRYPEKFYTYLRSISPISELLLIPMHSGHAWAGTIWVICHETRRKFDAEDARLMTQLARLASAVCKREFADTVKSSD